MTQENNRTGQSPDPSTTQVGANDIHNLTSTGLPTGQDATQSGAEKYPGPGTATERGQPVDDNHPFGVEADASSAAEGDDAQAVGDKIKQGLAQGAGGQGEPSSPNPTSPQAINQSNASQRGTPTDADLGEDYSEGRGGNRGGADKVL